MSRMLLAILSALPVLACAAQPARPAPEPPHERLVYSSYRPAGWDIYLYEGQGHAPVRLTDHPALDYSATLSPDGRWVVFTSERGGDPSLYALDRDTRAPARLLVRGEGMQDQGTISPDGKWLVFVGTHGGDADIYRMPFRPDATQDIADATNLSRHPGGDFRPAFSPDGHSIAFSSDRDGTPSRHPAFSFALRHEADIYTMDVDGAGVRRLTTTAGWDGSPAWSEDGRRLVFYSERDQPGAYRVYSMSADGQDARPLSPEDLPALSPSIARDGTLLLSTWTQTGQNPDQRRWQVKAMGADGTVRDVSDPAMDCLGPAVHRPTGAMVCHGGPPVAGDTIASFAGPLLVDGDPRVVALPDRTLALAGARHAFTTPADPGRDELVFRHGPRRIGVASATGDAPGELLDLDDLDGNPPGSVSHLRYTRDGQWISFTVGPFAGPPDAPADVWRMRADGSEAANLTPDTPANDGLAEFSADGQRFVFRSGRDGNFHLYLGNVDGTPPRKLTDGAGNDTFPALSPRGGQVAFVSDRNGLLDEASGRRTFDVYTLDLAPDGTPGAIRQRTRNDAQDAHVGYSPDGAWLVYTSGKAGLADEAPLVQEVLFNPQMYGEIYAHRLADGHSVRLTHNKWEDGAPVWATAAAAPARPLVADRLGDVLETQGAEAALARYRALQRDAPTGYRFGEGGLYSLAQRYLAAGDDAAAMETYELLAALRPDSPRPFMALGDARLAKGDRVDAAVAYRKALGIRPDDLAASWSLFRAGADGYAEVPLTPARVQEFVARYRHPEFGLVLEFTERDGILFVAGPGQPAPWPMGFVGDDRFYVKPNPGAMRFIRDPAGKVIGVEAHHPSAPPIRLDRIE